MSEKAVIGKKKKYVCKQCIYTYVYECMCMLCVYFDGFKASQDQAPAVDLFFFILPSKKTLDYYESGQMCLDFSQFFLLHFFTDVIISLLMYIFVNAPGRARTQNSDLPAFFLL